MELDYIGLCEKDVEIESPLMDLHITRARSVMSVMRKPSLLYSMHVDRDMRSLRLSTVYGVYTVPVLRIPSPFRQSHRGANYTAVFVWSMYGSVKSFTNINYFSMKILTIAVLMHYNSFHP